MPMNRCLHGNGEVDIARLKFLGARQVGKTYLVNKFADKEYAHKEYINLLEMSGELLMDHYPSDP